MREPPDNIRTTWKLRFAEHDYMVSVFSDRGRSAHLPENQDSVTSNIALRPSADLIILLAVADGVGGNVGGAFASRTVIDALGQSLVQSSLSPEVSLVEAIHAAHTHLYQKNVLTQPNKTQYRSPASKTYSSIEIGSADIHLQQLLEQPLDAPSLSDKTLPATTLTAAVVAGNKAWIGHVGDSRAYLVQGGTIRQVTVDDHDPQGSGALTQALGLPGELKPHLSALLLQSGDLLVLCSDGLTKEISDRELLRIAMGRQKQEGNVAQWLGDAALQRGGRDNITVIALGYDSSAPPVRDSRKNRRQMRMVAVSLIMVLLLMIALSFIA